MVNIKLIRFLWIQVGPQFNAHVSVVDKDNVIKSGVDIINKQSYSAVGGLWVQLPGVMPLLRFNAGVRYVAGLNSLNSLSGTQMWRSQMVQLHVGIGF